MEPYLQDLRDSALLSAIPWEKLDSRILLVTGASGLIGSTVAELAATACPSCTVIAGGRNRERMEHRFAHLMGKSNFKLWIQDLSGNFSLPEKGISYIVHAAGMAAPVHYAQKPVEVIEENFRSLSHLARLALKESSCRLLYVSSDEVYGQSSQDVLKEEDCGYVPILQPRSCYPASKRLCETLASSYACEYGLDTVIVRPSHVYGPFYTESDNRVYAQFFRKAVKGEDLVMKSQGDQLRSWCYSVDCASAILCVLLRGTKGQAYNISDNSSAFTIRELAEMTATAGGCSIGMALPPEEERRGYNPVRQSVLDTRKLLALDWRSLPKSPSEKIRTCLETRKEYEKDTAHP